MILEKVHSSHPNIVRREIMATHEQERLRQLLRHRLSSCGWREEVTRLCKQAVRDGSSEISVDDIVDQVTPKARSLVPATVKKELLQEIKKYLMLEAGLLQGDNA